MDKLSVTTTTNTDGTFSTRWQWWQNINLPCTETRLPKAGGTITVSLAPRLTEDRAVLAEISAIHQLLCVAQVQGGSRLGANMEIGVSFGAIRKALLKSSLKTKARGETDKHHVALFTKFLATKFFEANIVTDGASKWIDSELENPRDFAIEVNREPGVEIWTAVGGVSITHHAINRVVERRMACDIEHAEDDLRSIPDKKWSRAWRWLQRVLPASMPAYLPDSVMSGITAKHGAGVAVLRSVSTQSVFILKPARHGWDMVTVTDDRYSNWLMRKYQPNMAAGSMHASQCVAG